MERMAPTAILTLQFSCTFQSIGTGNSAKTTSVSTETLELKKAANFRFPGGMHFPVAVPPHVKARGWHWKKTVTVRVSDCPCSPGSGLSLTKVTGGRQNGEDDCADDKLSESDGRCEPHQEEADADLGQAEANQTQWLRDEVEMKSFDDIGLRNDVLHVASRAVPNLGDDDHHLSKEYRLRRRTD